MLNASLNVWRIGWGALTFVSRV